MAQPRYDAVAQSYGGEFDDYSLSATEALLELAGVVDGLQVLDLACGHGLIAREMARRGAATVVGVDLSAGLLERARAQEAAEPLGIDYAEGDASSPATMIGRRFDLVVCNFGLSDIDDLDGLCATVARVLTAGGRFVFSMLHPCFPGVEGVSSAWPTGGRYYDEGWWRADGELSSLRREVGANHRTLSTYVNTLRRHGLMVDQVREPAPNESLVAQRPGIDAFPLYLAVRCTRS